MKINLEIPIFFLFSRKSYEDDWIDPNMMFCALLQKKQWKGIMLLKTGASQH